MKRRRVTRFAMLLILRGAGIDVLIPEKNSAGEGLGVFETGLAEHLRDLERSRAAAAVNNDAIVLVIGELRRDLRPLGAREKLVLVHDVRDVPFVWLADGHDDDVVSAVEVGLELARGDFPVGFELVTRWQTLFIKTRT